MALPVNSPIVQSTTTAAISSSAAAVSVAPSASSTATSIAATSSLTSVAAVTTPSSSSNPVTSSSSSTTSSANVATTTAASSVAAEPTSATTSSPAKSTSARVSATFVVQTSDNGQVFTQTSIVTISGSTPTVSSAVAQASSTPNSFFHNTGAVAGVFSVAGILGLILVFLLFTSYIRRRRARQFDREIDEAAAEAATAKPPDFDDFDFTSATGMGYGYSDASHGTYSQPPLSHEQPRNGSYDPYPGVGVAGAAGVGARGRSLRSGGQQDPFGALANPLEQYEMQETQPSWNQGSLRGGAGALNYDIVHAAGLAGGDPYAVTRGASTNSGFSHSQSGMSGLARSLSQGASTLPTSAENYPMPTPAPGYPSGQDTPYPPEKTRYSASFPLGGGVSTMPPDGDEDVYGGYQDQPSAGLDSPQSPGLAGPRARSGEDEGLAEKYTHGSYPHEQEEAARTSFADDDDYGYNSGQRVLRVANV